MLADHRGQNTVILAKLATAIMFLKSAFMAVKVIKSSWAINHVN
jgi:hypothetical protein